MGTAASGSGARIARPWSARTRCRARRSPRCTPGPSGNCDRQSGNRSASSWYQLTSSTVIGSSGSGTSTGSRSSRTAWQCAGSASTARPDGPSTSSNRRTSPGAQLDGVRAHAQRGPGGADREAAAQVAPRVELDPAARGQQGGGVQRLEHHRRPGEGGLELARRDGRTRGVVAAEDPRAGRDRGAVRAATGGDVDRDPRPGVAAVVHEVVEEPGVASDRDAPTAGPEVRLGRDRVLEVAELVTDVRQQLDEGDLLVRRVALPPAGHDEGEAVEQEPAEARVVLGEVVDLRARHDLRWALVLGAAVEVGGAVDLEREVDLGQLRVEPVGRMVVDGRAGEHQAVRREVADRARPDDQQPVGPGQGREVRPIQGEHGRIAGRRRRDPGRLVGPLDADRVQPRVQPHATLDAHVALGHVVGKRLEAPDEERPLRRDPVRCLVAQDLEVVDAVDVRPGADALQPPVLVLADVLDTHRYTSREKVAVCGWPEGLRR